MEQAPDPFVSIASQVRSLPLTGAGLSVASIGGPGTRISCCTVWISVEGAEPTADDPVPTVRAELTALVRGIRQSIGVMWIQAGQTGAPLIVSGLIADSWQLTLRASSPRISADAGLIGSGGCAHYTVTLNPPFNAPPAGVAEELLFPEPALPISDDPPVRFERGSSLWGNATSVDVPPGATFVSVQAFCDPAAALAGEIGGLTDDGSIPIEPGVGCALYAAELAQVTAPRTITFSPQLWGMVVWRRRL